MFFAGEEIAFPPELAEALAQGLWRGSPDAAALKRRGGALNLLWEKLAKRRGIKAEGETHYSFKREEAEAYASYYLPANALKPAFVLEEAFLTGADLMGAGDAVWLDCGTGPGTAYWGLAWWCKQRGKKLQFHGWDQSPIFADLGSSLAAAGKLGAAARFIASKKEDVPTLVRKLGATHVSFMNSAAEIFPDPARRLEEMKKIWSALSDLSRRDGKPRYLVLIEPGSRENSRELSALKDAMPVKPFLPCLDARPCGALARPQDWCHEEVAVAFPSWMNALGAEAGLRKESLLFSYAVFGTAGDFPLRDRWRVVSQRLERKGQTECWLCTPEGKRSVRAQLSKAGPGSAPVIEARRGDIWADPRVGEKGDLEQAARFTAPGASVFSLA